MNARALQDVVSKIKSEMEDGDLVGIAMVTFGKKGKIRIEYTDYAALHPAQAVGYLNLLCQEITDTMRK